MNVSFIPLISQDVPAFLDPGQSGFSHILVLYPLERECQTSVQSHRTAALGFLVLFPFIMYLFLRVMFLQNDGTNPVMLNRWRSGTSSWIR